MASSKVLVVGAGALGQNTALSLALAGVGEIRIVDRDEFEDHNRTRSPAYPLPEERSRYGMGKARAVACKLHRLMTAPRSVMRYAHNWIQELGDGAFKEVSVVVSCVDSQLARAYLSDKSRQHGLPFIEGGFEGEHVTLTTFPAVTGDEARTTPCWRCSHPGVRGSFSCRNYAARAEAAGIIPAVQNAAAVLGGFQAEAVILAIHRELQPTRRARAFDLNIRTWQSYTINLATNSKCPGTHRLFEREPIRLQTSADDTVEQLICEMSEHLGSNAWLRLPLKLYGKVLWNMPCQKCGRMAAVHGPEWRWMMNPRCSRCGGEFPLNGAESGSPDTYPELSADSKRDVLRVKCREIGLVPLSLFEGTCGDSASPFYDDNASTTLFELPGLLEELLRTGELQ